MIKKILVILGMILFFASSASADWLSTHSYRMKIAIDSTNVSSNLSNFPLYVTFIDDSIGANARSDGFDIVFTSSDGTTNLPYDRERFSVSAGTATGFYFVNVTSIVSTDSTWLYLYYGDPDSGDLEDESSAWNGDYEYIQHLEEGYSTAADFYKDETGNSNDGTLTDANTNSSFVIAKIDSAIDFNGDADQIISTDASLTGPIPCKSSGAANDFTVSAWIYVNDEGSRRPIVIKQKSNPGLSRGFAFMKSGTGGDRLVLEVAKDNSNVTEVESTADLSDSTWYYVTGIYDYVTDGTSEIFLYIDGSNDGSSTTAVGPPQANSVDLQVGGYENDSQFAGIIDEVRVSSIVRTANWIKFEYENMNQADHEMVWHAQEKAPQLIIVN